MAKLATELAGPEMQGEPGWLSVLLERLLDRPSTARLRPAAPM